MTITMKEVNTMYVEYEQSKCTELKTITLKNDWRRRINTVLKCEHINMADIVGVSADYCPILNETTIIIKVL